MVYDWENFEFSTLNQMERGEKLVYYYGMLRSATRHELQNPTKMVDHFTQWEERVRKTKWET